MVLNVVPEADREVQLPLSIDMSDIIIRRLILFSSKFLWNFLKSHLQKEVYYQNRQGCSIHWGGLHRW